MAKPRHILISENTLKGSKTQQLKVAIIKRHPVTFYYSSKDRQEVLRGTRIRGEFVALGLSKKGNLIARGYVQPPSVSKKGFQETGWRTFRLDRMTSIRVLTDETFDKKREQYKDGDESNTGPMEVTYVTSDWEGLNVDAANDIPTNDVNVDVGKTNLPEPRKNKPPQDPLEDTEDDVEAEVEPTVIDIADLNVEDIDGQKFILQTEYDNLVRTVYLEKEKQWKEIQRELGKNARPGQGTRNKLEMQTSIDVADTLRKNNVKVTQTLPQSKEPLNENVRRIKELMFFKLLT